MPAFFFNYRYQGAKTWIKKGGDKQNHFIGLLIGANWQAWRLRHYGSNSSHYHWQNYRTTLSRDIHAIYSQLSLGENYTSSILFDRFQFKGVQLQSDDSMLPDNAKGYAPVIHAIAETYATVTVLQNHIPIYQTYVPPGPFVINDLFPSYFNDKLKIMIDESNGKRRDHSADQILSINLQIPFKRWLKRTWESYGIQNSFNQRLIQQINIHHSPFADES
ncbi:hypothetical protein BBD39_06860 [Arsenophonus endosymbiont of Bemisia tabaci Asia II 3]|nr:hypothetical protein BBD39_06860 [Arsenophonus endosymbiont of Bemisia tabaci Asia II 3]